MKIQNNPLDTIEDFFAFKCNLVILMCFKKLKFKKDLIK
jgi:hypothetical protein